MAPPSKFRESLHDRVRVWHGCFVSVEQSWAPGWYPVAGGMVQWWDGAQWRSHPVHPPGVGLLIAQQERRTNHVLHLLLTLLTFGMWGLVWAVVALVNRSERARLRREASWVARGTPPR